MREPVDESVCQAGNCAREHMTHAPGRVSHIYTFKLLTSLFHFERIRLRRQLDLYSGGENSEKKHGREYVANQNGCQNVTHGCLTCPDASFFFEPRCLNRAANISGWLSARFPRLICYVIKLELRLARVSSPPSPLPPRVLLCLRASFPFSRSFLGTMFAALALFALLAPSAHAFWRLPCNKPVLDAVSVDHCILGLSPA
jgi:hypothetical protein